jgi:hypothetical protein
VCARGGGGMKPEEEEFCQNTQDKQETLLVWKRMFFFRMC